MSAWSPPAFTGRHIIVADEDRRMVDMIIQTLRNDGQAVFHAYDVLSATQLAMGLEVCNLVISNTKVEGADGVELIQYLRKRRPTLPISYLANLGRSTLEMEAQLPADIPSCVSPSRSRTWGALSRQCSTGRATGAVHRCGRATRLGGPVRSGFDE